MIAIEGLTNEHSETFLVILIYGRRIPQSPWNYCLNKSYTIYGIDKTMVYLFYPF